jgi:hypothetical protein
MSVVVLQDCCVLFFVWIFALESQLLEGQATRGG